MKLIIEHYLYQGKNHLDPWIQLTDEASDELKKTLEVCYSNQENQIEKPKERRGIFHKTYGIVGGDHYYEIYPNYIEISFNNYCGFGDLKFYKDTEKVYDFVVKLFASIVEDE